MRTIRNTTIEDLPYINDIYAYARKFMKENGNPTQWGDTRPLPNAIIKDINEKNSYVILENEVIIGVFSFIDGHDETYDIIEDGAWLNEEPYGVIHKIASAPNVSGVLKDALKFASGRVKNIRIDTHHDNTVMQHLLKKAGFTYCGIIYTDDGTKRLAYQKIMSDFTIRRIEKKDDARVAFIIRECLIEYGGDHRPDTAWADPYLDHFSEVYVLENNAYWVAENEYGEIIASVGIGPMSGIEGVCELQKMYCVKSYRGTGIAGKLLNTALDFAKNYYNKCYLETMDNMDRAKAFYEKNGFVHTNETIGCTGHCGCNYHYIMDL